MNSSADFSIAVVGAGPVGSATAWHLSRMQPGVGVVARSRAHEADTFRQSGGSVCWHRPDPAKAAAIEETARFIQDQARAGAPIRVRETPYLFLDDGTVAPALNVAAADLVDHLRRDAPDTAALDVGDVRAVERHGAHYRVVGDSGDATARVVVLALGTATATLVPSLTGAIEKRTLMVLDVPVGPERAQLPHLVARLGDGYVYTFVKEVDGELRLLLGQEDLVDDDSDGPVDQLPELMRQGLAARLPFLEGAHTERILWGTDWVAKTPVQVQETPGLISLTCGSAVRSCYALGRQAAAAAQEALARTAA